MANIMRLLQETPFNAMLESVGTGISKAQLAMDTASIDILRRLLDEKVELPGADGEPAQRSLLELGFTPTFYHISEVLFEAKVALSMSESQEINVNSKLRAGTEFSLFSATVDAHYSNKYSFSAEGSSSIKAKFVALPPPQELREALQKAKPSQPAEPVGEGH
jgi:hypothetical protein